jgi:hypothetical protein
MVVVEVVVGEVAGVTVEEVVVGAGGGGGEVGVVVEVVVVTTVGGVMSDVPTRMTSLSAPAPTDVAPAKASPMKSSVQL